MIFCGLCSFQRILEMVVRSLACDDVEINMMVSEKWGTKNDGGHINYSYIKCS